MSRTRSRRYRDTGGTERARRPGPSPKRLIWWIPQTVQALTAGLVIANIDPPGWYDAVIVAGLAAQAGLVLLLETRLARRAQEGRAEVVMLDGSGGCPGHAAEMAEMRGRIVDCEMTGDMLIDTLKDMCRAAGIELAERPDLHVIDGGQAPVALRR